MKLQKFVDKTVIALQEYYGPTAKVETHKIYKNNGILLQSVCVLSPEKNIAPTIYLNDFFELYETGEPFNQIFRSIVDCIDRNQIAKNLNVDFFLNYQQLKTRLVYRLIHRSRNEELLKQVPYIPFHDLAIVCHCLILNETIGTGSILIHHHHLETWGITEKELFQDAEENSLRLEPYSLVSMTDVVKDIMRNIVAEQVEEICREYPVNKEKMIEGALHDMVTELVHSPISMMVLTNTSRYYGAACLVYPQVLEEIGEKLGTDFYVLPSSVHEVIVLPVSDEGEETYLNEMIQEINQTQVEKEEWLADHAYLYQREEKSLISI